MARVKSPLFRAVFFIVGLPLIYFIVLGTQSSNLTPTCGTFDTHKNFKKIDCELTASPLLDWLNADYYKKIPGLIAFGLFAVIEFHFISNEILELVNGKFGLFFWILCNSVPMIISGLLIYILGSYMASTLYIGNGYFNLHSFNEEKGNATLLLCDEENLPKQTIICYIRFFGLFFSLIVDAAVLLFILIFFYYLLRLFYGKSVIKIDLRTFSSTEQVQIV